MYDVVVVGGGPAGAAAARRCAALGLGTLILEKERLPRNKVCSGWVMGVGFQLISAEYGEIPEEVLAPSPRLQGYICHVPEGGVETIEAQARVSWRRNLDHWLVRKAQEQGAELWEEARLTELVEGSPCTIRLSREGVAQEIQARFVIGADGANSHVRKALFPDLEIPLSQAYQEYFEVETSLERGYGHLYVGTEIAPFYGAVHRKDNLIVFETGARMGHVKEAGRWVREAMAREYKVDLSSEPAGKDACVEAVLYSQLFKGTFQPARGNVLIIGDAAGLMMPVTGEGIGCCMLSGLAAAMAVKAALKKNLSADELYLKGIRGLLGSLQEPYQMVREIRQQADEGPKALLEAMVSSWRRTLALSERVVASVEF